MADSWDDAALIDAFNASLRKYQEMHSRKKKQADKIENENSASNEENLEAHEPVFTEEESNHCEEANATHQELKAESFGIENQPYNEQYTQSSQQGNSYWSGLDPSNPYMPYQYPQPWGYQPPYICPPLVCAPYPCYPGFQGNHCCNTSHTCPCASQSPSLRSSAPAANFEVLKAAVRAALSQLPDKVIGEDKLNGSNGEVLLAWFNAGFQTASHLHQANKLD